MEAHARGPTDKELEDLWIARQRGESGRAQMHAILMRSWDWPPSMRAARRWLVLANAKAGLIGQDRDAAEAALECFAMAIHTAKTEHV